MKNIILVLIDALRYDFINTTYTPNLMRIIKDGVFYNNCYSGNSCTLKSIPIILSSKSKYNYKHSIQYILRKYGYNTTLITSNVVMNYNFSRGWSESIDLFSLSKYSYLKNPVIAKIRRKLIRVLPDFLYIKMKKIYRIFVNETYVPYIRAKETFNCAVNKISTINLPFFIFVHIMDAHYPYFPLSSKYNNKDIVYYNDKLYDVMLNKQNPKNKEGIIWKELYGEEIKYMDYYLGKFYDSINKEDTVLVITSDHGEEFGEKDGFGHKCDKFIPELCHVPLIIVGNRKNKIINIKTSHYDLKPIIFHLIGL